MAHVGFKSISDFASLFKGKDTAYGVHIPSGERDENGKLKGKSFTRTGNVTMNSYVDHLEGTAGLGVIPVTDTDRCWFGAIDVDDYSGERSAVLSMIRRSDLPLCPFRSKSGGLHLFLFFGEDSPVTATKLITILSDIRDAFGMPAETEIFPKQRSVKGAVGNWINLPYFGESDRKLLDFDGRPVELEQALDWCMERRTNEETIARLIAELPFSDGPPCLQSLALRSSFPSRNNYIFSAARYYKAKYGEDEFAERVMELNSTLADPLPEDEIQKTVIASHSKKDYSYKCRDTPLCDVCLKVRCRTRRFGVGSSEVSELNFGAFRQFMTDPPYYEWEVNGKPLKFYSEGELINQKSFQEQCVRHLNLKPAQLKAPAWDAILNTALKNVQVRAVDSGSEMSEGATFREYLVEFLTGRAMAASRIHILLDRVYHDTDIGAYVFRAAALNRFLFDQKKFTLLKRGQVMDRLTAMKGQAVRYFIDDAHRAAPVWTVPVASVAEFTDGKDLRVEVDFLEDEAEEF